nr:TIGR04100 family radical SAM protein [uncultured Niameybacter sp.]
MTILYKVNKSLYINITNACPCACVFCVRLEHDSVGECENLWLEHEPSLEEILNEFEKHDLKSYEEIVFCGYGEPLERLDMVIEVAKWIKQRSTIPVRVNTNGLADLIHGKETAYLLEGLVDAISISLNAPDAKTYLEISRPSFGEAAYSSLLHFATACKKVIPQVSFSVVDVISKEQIEACSKLADEMGIPLRVRRMIR